MLASRDSIATVASFASIAALSWLASSCSASREAIRGEDSSTLFPGARFSLDLSRRTAEQPSKRITATLDVDVSYASSEFRQDVAVGETVGLDGTLITGPTELDVEFELWRALLDARMRLRSARGVGCEVFAGVGVNQLHVDVEDSVNGVRADDQLHTVGPLVGAAVFFEPLDRLRFYVEGSFNPSFGSSVESADIDALEVGLRCSLDRHAALALAWRRVQVDAERDSFDSDLELESSGPAVLLWLVW